MKNIHVLPTEKPSKLYFNHNKGFEKYQFSKEPFINGLTNTTNQHIYITNSEEIKEGDYYLPFSKSIVKKTTKYGEIGKSKTSMDFSLDYLKKIILTTDQDLIADGVQAIDDEFLEWFVKNPSCECVEIDKGYRGVDLFNYKIIIPKEEPKKEILEEVAKKYAELSYYGDEVDAFVRGAKWQSERMYSEEDMQEYAEFCIRCNQNGLPCIIAKDWFKQFKKK